MTDWQTAHRAAVRPLPNDKMPKETETQVPEVELILEQVEGHLLVISALSRRLPDGLDEAMNILFRIADEADAALRDL